MAMANIAIGDYVTYGTSCVSFSRETIPVITIDQVENTAVNKNDEIHLYLWPSVASSFLVRKYGSPRK